MERGIVKGAVVGSIVSSVVMVSATAFAGTGIGALFNLGATNRVNAQSTLAGSTTGRNLQLTNTGTGSALGVAVGAGKAPLVVSAGAGTAPNLSADKLDGLDSTAFYKKTDTVANATHATSADNATNATNATNAANATNATNANNAANADSLGGLPASGYQQSCVNGAVMGRAEINAALASTENWTTTGVNANTAWVCDSSHYGSNVLVKQVSTGRFDVVFGQVINGNTMGLGTGQGPLAQVTSETEGYRVVANGPWQCAFGNPPPFYVSCWEVYVRDANGTSTNNGSFTITIG